MCMVEKQPNSQNYLHAGKSINKTPLQTLCDSEPNTREGKDIAHCCLLSFLAARRRSGRKDVLRQARPSGCEKVSKRSFLICNVRKVSKTQQSLFLMLQGPRSKDRTCPGSACREY